MYACVCDATRCPPSACARVSVCGCRVTEVRCVAQGACRAGRVKGACRAAADVRGGRHAAAAVCLAVAYHARAGAWARECEARALRWPKVVTLWPKVGLAAVRACSGMHALVRVRVLMCVSVRAWQAPQPRHCQWSYSWSYTGHTLSDESSESGCTLFLSSVVKSGLMSKPNLRISQKQTK